MTNNDLILVVGLGNPGKKYSNTWHNLGFMVVDRIAEKYNLSFKAGKGEFFSATGFIGRKKVILLKPTTYMNLSGRAVRQLADYYNIQTDNIFVIYDDINISLGNIRLRSSGSAGGHNGIKSIISSLGSDAFPRLKVGFSTGAIENVRNRNKGALPDVVLSIIPSKMKDDVDISINNSIDCFITFMESGINRAMNLFNTKEST